MDIVIAPTTEPIVQRVALDTVEKERVLDPINCLLRTSDHTLWNFIVETFRQIITFQKMTLYNFEAVIDIGGGMNKL